jgi:Ca2+-binding EF-hand superfamily protein
MKRFIRIAAGFCLCVAAPCAAQQAQSRNMRFQDMDRNGDGMITRDEWRGNDRSFANHDWNGDGKLSGDEVRAGARRNSRWDDRDVETSIGYEDDRTVNRFRTLDHDNNGRLSRAEWHATSETFSRLDRNRDGALTVGEFTASEDDDTEDRFSDLDTNHDGSVSRSEWHGSAAVFTALDANRDGVLTRAEAVGNQDTAPDEFRSLDVNNDGAVARDEWHWNTAAFDRLDANRDGRLSRGEFQASTPPSPQESAAYRAGYDRGRIEGLQAGREDKPRHWDLEGQRELEDADSGYQASMGNRNDYQAGYRTGFRSGYREGFGAR